MNYFSADINICAPYYGREDIRRLFEEKAVAEAWLMFEGVLSEAQGELGLIPANAEFEIKEKATLAHVGFKNIVKIYGATKHTGKAVVIHSSRYLYFDQTPLIDHYQGTIACSIIGALPSAPVSIPNQIQGH